MKTYKWFLILIAIVSVACSGSSEDELVGNWVNIGDFGGARRAYASSFVIGNVGYVCAGYNGYQTSRRDMWKIEVDSDGVGTWSISDSLPKGMERQRAVGFSVNGKGYIGTGWDGDEKLMRDFWEYDPTKSGTVNAWREVAPLPLDADARYGAISFVIKGEAYVGTGFIAGKDQDCLLDFWKFIPPSVAPPVGRWEKAPAISKKRSGASVFVINDVAYVCTGNNNGGITGNLWDFWCFDGTSWKELRHINNYDQNNDYDDAYVNIGRTNAVGFTLNGKGYIAGGNTPAVWEYEPPVYSGSRLVSGDLWTQKTSFFSRYGMVTLEFANDNVFVGTGLTANSYFQEMYHFYPDDEDNIMD